jgi:hypothetical protein
MPGAQCTRSRACRVGSTRVSHHGRTGTPGIPARDGVNVLLRALPGESGFVVTVALKKLASQELDANH